MVEIKGRVDWLDIIDTGVINEVITRDGLYQQKKNLTFRDILNLSKAKIGDTIKITIEKL